MEATYQYPPNGARAETIATLADGRRVTVNTQYGKVFPHGDHGDGCAQMTRIGGVCDCGLLDGIDVDALVADACERGLRGSPPKQQRAADEARKLDELEADRRRIERAMTLDGGTY